MILSTLRAGMKLKNGLAALVFALLTISVFAQDATTGTGSTENPAVTSEALQSSSTPVDQAATPEKPADAPAPAAPAEAVPATTDSTATEPAATETPADTDTTATETPTTSEDAASTEPAAGGDASAAPEFKTLDQDVQSLKKNVLDLNRELFVLEEELLYPADTQVAFFVSMDVGTFFGLDTVTLKIDNKEVANYLYTARETQALLKGGVQRVYVGNLKVGEHELVAFFTGKGPNQRDYKRGATLKFTKGVGAKYLELKISDKQIKEQPEFIIKEWE